jgi:CAAX protease family protein
MLDLVEVLILSTGALLWARWAKLDLGLRPPAMKGVWAWSLLFVAWIIMEKVILSIGPVAAEPESLQEIERMSLVDIVLLVVLGPIAEELLFRGALFSALMRRWGPWPALTVPSALWALTHIDYEPWLIASIAASGVFLAIIRWKSGSLYPPVALHVGANLLDFMLSA